MKLWLSISILMVVAVSTGCQRRGVSIAISDAVAKQERDYLDVSCVAALDNQTGSPLVVTSLFSSAFDLLHVVVSATNSTYLAEQAYALHQSPQNIPGRELVLPPGITTQLMTIPVFGLTNTPARVSLQLTGRLWSSYSGCLASEAVDVPVRRP